MGTGYAPHVDECDGVLTYSLPVDSGFMTYDFAFVIRRDDLAVLLADPYRRAVLEVIAHTVLQRSTFRGNRVVAQAEFDVLVRQVLHGSDAALNEFVLAIGREHNIAIGIYVDAAIARRSARKR
jgi:hypothetical protein